MDVFTSHLVLGSSPVPIAAFFSPSVPINPLPPIVRTKNIPQCPRCHAALTVFSSTDARCPFCRYTNISKDLLNCISPSPVVDFPHFFGGANVHPSDRLKRVSATLFVVDGTATRAELIKLKNVIVEEMRTSIHLDRESLIGIIVCGAAISVYELGGGLNATDAAVTDIYPGTGMLSDEEHHLLARHEEGEMYGSSNTYLAPSFMCMDNVEAVLSALPGLTHPGQSRRSKRRLALQRRRNQRRGGGGGEQHQERNGKQEEDEMDADMDVDVEDVDVPIAPCSPKRCLLKATEVALALIEAHHCYSGHVMICTSGGETERCDAKKLGRLAALANIRIDVMTFSQEKVHGLKELAKLTNGRTDGMLTHASLVSEYVLFQKNMRASLQRCRAMLQRTAATSFSSAVSPPLLRMTVNTSPGLHLKQCIGPITASKKWTTKQMDNSNNNHNNHGHHNWGMVGETSTQFTITSQAIDSAITMYFTLSSGEIQSTVQSGESAVSQHVYVQFILHNCWKEEEQEYVTRIITRRLMLAKDVQSHLRSMDPQRTAVALVKRAILSCRHRLSQDENGDAQSAEESDEEDRYQQNEREIKNYYDDAKNGEEEEEERRKFQVAHTCELLDLSLQRLAQWFSMSMLVSSSDSEGGGGGDDVSSSKKVTTFTHELMEVAKTLYNTRRLLTNEVGKHCDDLTLFVSRLLSADVVLSERMLSPTLYGVRAEEIRQLRQRSEREHRGDSIQRQNEEEKINMTFKATGGGGGTGTGTSLSSVLHLMRPVPLSTLSMSSDMMLVLHSASEIHVWSGGLVAGVEYDKVRQELSNDVDRMWMPSCCPVPRKIMSFESSSDARSLYARLEPSHMDSEFVQLKSFGSLLGGLTKIQLKTLRGKMLPTQELTLFAYVSKLFAQDRR